jgi:hypothetical protein
MADNDDGKDTRGPFRRFFFRGLEVHTLLTPALLTLIPLLIIPTLLILLPLLALFTIPPSSANLNFHNPNRCTTSWTSATRSS